MARKSEKRESKPVKAVVDFTFQDRTYQIDPQRQKVYRKFVQIETSRAMQIFSVWRSRNAQA